MSFTYPRTIHFNDTDAAGVVFFANVLTICHEAYESSLAEAGVDIRKFFSTANKYAVPIVHASIDFLSPIFCGDRLSIYLEPQILNEYSFEITYWITQEGVTPPIPLGEAKTKHVCINTVTRARAIISEEIKQWLFMTVS
jgi:1,4-dihydroxy-2-naphthoyl-CoA hydrolase